MGAAAAGEGANSRPWRRSTSFAPPKDHAVVNRAPPIQPLNTSIMKRAMRVVSVPGSLCLVLAAACASAVSTPSAAPRAACPLGSADSVVVSGGAVYRDCAVDRKAQLRTTRVKMDFTFPSHPRCYSAEVEFVVDTAGLVEMQTVRVVTTNDTPFARALIAILPKYRYDPARIAGRPVRQMVTEQRKDYTEMVRVVVGTTPTPGPPPC